ncbi:ATP-binding protein [Paenibacillus sp. TRM 82003]|nr:ATP-binding protein [Paenibacillus sp. TRM 82003]
MTKKILFRLLSPLIVCSICVFSIYLQRTPNALLLIALGVALIYCMTRENKRYYSVSIQVVFLFLFHWVSELNWCFSLYIIILIRQLLIINSISKALLFTLSTVFIYSAVRLSYSEISTYAVLITFIDMLSLFVVVALVWYAKDSEKEKAALRENNNQLLHYDALTGLLNYHEFRRRMEKLSIQANQQICFLIVDCYNLKTLNVQHGYNHLNESLRSIAEQLTQAFPNSTICRYSGGQFALVAECADRNELIRKISAVCDVQIPEHLGIQVIYGYAFAASDNSDEWIAEAENELIRKERELWLKRDEHIFRADRMKVIGELAAGMAHEIRNPLTTIKGFLQMAHKDNYQSILRYHDTIMSEITRINNLTVEFLHFSKTQISELKVQEIRHCIDRAILILDNELSRLGHNLTTEIADGPLLVNAETDKLIQVLVNLVKNSVEAIAQQGKVEIRAYASNGFVLVEVSDNGTGMTEETISKLFDPFFTTKEHGTGLGLPISQKIIVDHGGSLDVESTLGQGTTFTILLPMVKG